jgi:hypothetical protein
MENGTFNDNVYNTITITDYGAGVISTEQYMKNEYDKQYQKQYQKHEGKYRPHETNSTWHQEELPFYSHVSKKYAKLTNQQFEDLFWDHLVKIGWRRDDEAIVLVCPKCESGIYIVTITEVGTTPDKTPQYLKDPEQHIKTHNRMCRGNNEG